MYTNAQMSADEQKMQQAMTAYGQPSSMHQMLAKSTGEWTETTKMWMSANAQPITNTITCKNEMVMNGLFQEGKHTGNFMGMPFDGISTTGYDNVRKVFTNTWRDNMSSGVMYCEGTYNEAKKCIEFKGKTTCPIQGKSTDFSQTLWFIDDNTQKLEMWGPDPKTGKTFKNMEITLTRKS